MWVRSTVLSLPLILFIAVCLRLGFAWNYQHPRTRQALSTIPFLSEPGNIAYSLATGRGFSSPFRVETGPTAWMTPVYPLLLAGIFRLFGIYTFSSFIAAVLLNILFSVLTCVPIFFIGKRIAGLGVAAGAAWLWAVFPNAIILSAETLWDQSLAALLAATILWATLALAESQRLRDWCGYGFLWGFALMTNTALISLLPFVLGWIVYRTRRQAGRPLDLAALALAIAAACCTPWTVRNYLVFHRFVPFRSALGLSLWLGNNIHTEDFPVGRMHPISSSIERAEYVQVGEFDYMRIKEREALQFIRSHPAIDAHFIGNRFIAFWSGGTPAPFKDLLRMRSNWFRFVLLFNLAAAVSALFGIVTLYRRHSEYTFPLAVFVIVFPCAYYLTLAIPRYRHPIDPVVLLLAAVAVAALKTTSPLASSPSRTPHCMRTPHNRRRPDIAA